MGRAVYYRGAGGVDVIEQADFDPRSPGPSEVVVSVRAAGVNRADLLQRRGLYPAPPGWPADVPGLEYAGEVVRAGADVTLCVGDRVMGIVGGGAHATEVVVHQSTALPIPTGMSFTDAAALPEAFLTAFDAAVVQGGLSAGQTLLVHAAGSGVGTAAIAIARQLGAASVGTSRTAGKLDRCAELGLDHPVIATDGVFADAVRAASEGRGADVILDLVGASYLSENLRAVAKRGSIIVVGLLGGATAQLPLGLLLAKRITLIGTVLRSRSLAEKTALCDRFAAELLPAFESGALSPIVDRVLPMADVAKAHELLEGNQTFGKIVLSW